MSDEIRNIAVRLGELVGLEPEAAYTSFMLLLRDCTIIRADNFGLSAKRIREYVMAHPEMDRSEAFRIAVMELAKEALS